MRIRCGRPAYLEDLIVMPPEFYYSDPNPDLYDFAAFVDADIDDEDETTIEEMERVMLIMILVTVSAWFVLLLIAMIVCLILGI